MAVLQVDKTVVDKPVDKELGRFWVMAGEVKSKPCRFAPKRYSRLKPIRPPNPLPYRV